MIINGVSLDPVQKDLVAKLEVILNDLSSAKKTGLLQNLAHKIFSNKTLPENKNSIYIYGGVGRGKTMISSAFFDEISVPKAFLHYQDCMRIIHDSIHQNTNESSKDVLVGLAKDMAKKYHYLCIDEFEVQDIADAMIVGRFFEVLLNSGVGVLMTSNTPPENLYSNGLQREQFVPFINLIKKNFTIFALNTPHDYRLDKIPSIEDRVFYPLNAATQQKMNEIKSELSDNLHYAPTVLEIFGRKITFKHTYKTVLVTSFDEICKQAFSANDFIKICRYFTAIIIENVKVIEKDETDVAIRFINFIDNVYFHKVLLFISLETEPEKIYHHGKREKEFLRTISRLKEINSRSYLEASKHS